MDYHAIRTELGVVLAGVSGVLVVYDTAPDRIVVPSIAVLPGEPFADYHTAVGSGGLVVLRFDVIVFARRFNADAGQESLDDLITAVPAVLESDQTLAGEASVVTVTDASNYGLVTVADTQYLGCRFGVEVHAR